MSTLVIAFVSYFRNANPVCLFLSAPVDKRPAISASRMRPKASAFVRLRMFVLHNVIRVACATRANPRVPASNGAAGLERQADTNAAYRIDAKSITGIFPDVVIYPTKTFRQIFFNST